MYSPKAKFSFYISKTACSKKFQRFLFFAALKLLLRKFYLDLQLFNPRERSAIQQNARVSRRYAVMIVALAYATIIFFLLGRPYVSMTIQARIGERVPLVQSDFYIFDYNDSPKFEIVWALQSFAVFLATLSYSGFDSLFAILVMHVCGQLALLIEQIKNLNHHDNITNSIARLVKRHYQLNRFEILLSNSNFFKNIYILNNFILSLSRFTKTIEKTFSWVLLAHIFACVIQLCLQGYQFLKVSYTRIIISKNFLDSIF